MIDQFQAHIKNRRIYSRVYLSFLLEYLALNKNCGPSDVSELFARRHRVTSQICIVQMDSVRTKRKEIHVSWMTPGAALIRDEK